MFRPGDMLSYPMHGICVVEAIEEKEVLGERKSYYMLRLRSDRMSAMIPVDKADEVGLRPVIPREDCEQVLRLLRAVPCEENDNWNQRYRENLTKLKGGDIFQVAEVVNCLNHRDAQRGLSSGERRMLLTARKVLVMELSAASGLPEKEFHEVVGIL